MQWLPGLAVGEERDVVAVERRLHEVAHLRRTRVILYSFQGKSPFLKHG